MEMTAISESAIEIVRSRCLRMRLDASPCNKCADNCRAGAISVNGDITVNRNACSECMLCTSECPSGCLRTAGLDFHSVLAGIKKVQSRVASPVLGCYMIGGLDSHAKTCCIGFLSEEHLITLSAFLTGTLQINLTECAGCVNSSAARTLKKKMEVVREKTSVELFDKIRLIEDKAELDYREDPFDRREFFFALKEAALQKAAGFLYKKKKASGITAYAEKALPIKREMLNKAIETMPDGAKNKIIKNYYYDVAVDERCDDCRACIGMCPTGALKTGRTGPGSPPVFKSALCIGCGLCRDFCANGSISVNRGFTRGDVFEFLETGVVGLVEYMRL